MNDRSAPARYFVFDLLAFTACLAFAYQNEVVAGDVPQEPVKNTTAGGSPSSGSTHSQETQFLNAPDEPVAEILAISPASDTGLAYTVRNTSSEIIEYVGYSATCSCTQLTIDKRRLAPGEEASVSAAVRAGDEAIDRLIDIATTFKPIKSQVDQRVTRYVHRRRILLRARPAIGWSNVPLLIRSEPGSEASLSIACYSAVKWHSIEARLTSQFLTCRTSNSTEQRHGADCQIARVEIIRNSVPIGDSDTDDVKLRLYAWPAPDQAVAMLLTEIDLTVRFTNLVEIAPQAIFLGTDPEATHDIVVMLRDREKQLQGCSLLAVVDNQAIALRPSAFTVSGSQLTARLKLDAPELNRVFQRTGELHLIVETSGGEFRKMISVQAPTLDR